MKHSRQTNLKLFPALVDEDVNHLHAGRSLYTFGQALPQDLSKMVEAKCGKVIAAAGPTSHPWRCHVGVLAEQERNIAAQLPH